MRTGAPIVVLEVLLVRYAGAIMGEVKKLGQQSAATVRDKSFCSVGTICGYSKN